MSPPPVVVIGLDLGDGELIRAWVQAGRLPNLGALLEGGIERPLDTTADALHVSAWPSLYTGDHPGGHGVYYTFQPAPDVQGYRRFAPGIYGRPPVWSLLAQAGIRCTVFDAPYTELEEISGVTQIVDWGAWAQYLGPSSRPGSLLRDLKRAVGDYPLGMEAHDIGLVPLDPGEMSARLADAASRRSAAASWLMAETEWDLFFCVYGEPHPGAHYCWTRREAGAQADLLPVYERIDDGIGELIECAPEGATVCVVSGDSVVPNQGGWHLLPDLLRGMGYLAEPREGADEEGAPGAKGGGLVRRLRDALPKGFRKSLARRLPTALRDRLARQVDTALIDWSRTRAFCLPTDLEGYIRINLAGREPQGIVRRADYQGVCDELGVRLRELVDPETGRRAVREVIQTSRRFPGPRQDRLPDLIVLWEDPVQLTELRSPAGVTAVGDSPDGRTGTHGSPGFLAVNGPGIEGWRDVRHVCDVAPALLRWFEAPVPEYMRERAVAGAS